MNIYKSKNGYYYKEIKKKKIRISKVVYDKLKGNKTTVNKTVGKKTVGKKGGANEYEREIIVMLIGFTFGAIERLYDRKNNNMTNNKKYRDVTMDVNTRYQQFLINDLNGDLNRAELMSNKARYVQLKKESENSENAQLRFGPTKATQNLLNHLEEKVVPIRNASVQPEITKNNLAFQNRMEKIAKYTNKIYEFNASLTRLNLHENRDSNIVTLINKYKQKIICILLNYTPPPSNNTPPSNDIPNIDIIHAEIKKFREKDSTYIFKTRPDVKLSDILPFTLFVKDKSKPGELDCEYLSEDKKNQMNDRLMNNHKDLTQISKQDHGKLCVTCNEDIIESRISSNIHHCRGCGVIVCSNHWRDINLSWNIYGGNYAIVRTSTELLTVNDPIINFTNGRKNRLHICSKCAELSRSIDIHIMVNNGKITELIDIIEQNVKRDIDANIHELQDNLTIDKLHTFCKKYTDEINSKMDLFIKFLDINYDPLNGELPETNTRRANLNKKERRDHINRLKTVNIINMVSDRNKHRLGIYGHDIPTIEKDIVGIALSEKGEKERVFRQFQSYIIENHIFNPVSNVYNRIIPDGDLKERIESFKESTKSLKNVSQNYIALTMNPDLPFIYDPLNWTLQINILNNLENTCLPYEIASIIRKWVISFSVRIEKLGGSCQVLDPIIIPITYMLINCNVSSLLMKLEMMSIFMDMDDMPLAFFTMNLTFATRLIINEIEEQKKRNEEQKKGNKSRNYNTNSKPNVNRIQPNVNRNQPNVNNNQPNVNNNISNPQSEGNSSGNNVNNNVNNNGNNNLRQGFGSLSMRNSANRKNNSSKRNSRVN